MTPSARHGFEGAPQAPGVDVNGIPQLTCADVADWLAQGHPLVDVREQEEWDVDHIPGAVLRPMSRLPEWADEIADQDVLFSCRSGQRSQHVAQALADRVRGRNLTGGILAYRAHFPEDA